MASVVRLKYGEAERSTRLVNNQLHIPTIKDMFGLSSVDIDGVAEPADDRGFTFASYMSGSVLEITGTPAQAAVLSGKAQDLPQCSGALAVAVVVILKVMHCCASVYHT